MSGFDEALAALSGLGEHRAWSLIVTVFGDMAPSSDLTGTALAQVLGPIGVRPEALRTALHRLRKEGWIESERSGQTSRHRLTRLGRSESLAARPRIYAVKGPLAKAWRLAALAPGADAARRRALSLAGWIEVSPGVVLGPADAAGLGHDDLALSGPLQHAPDWLRRAVETETPASRHRALLEALGAADAAIGSARRLKPVQIGTLRTLTVQNWRRLVLRHPALPDALHAPDWPGPACRVAVARFLDRLGHPDLAAL